MDAVEAAILRTLLYADVFKFALSFDELHYFLIHHQPVSPEQLRTTLENSTRLRELLCIADGYITLLENDHYIASRIQREAIARRLIPLANYYGRWLARIPFVRMVALTGALAVRNPAHEQDDFDYMLVTQPGRVWLARACAIVMVRLVRQRGIELCPNYVVAEDKLLQEQQDLYIAHEIAGMQPLYGYAVYDRLRQLNGWTQRFLSNASPAAPIAETTQNPVTRLLEWLLSGRFGAWLENWEYRRKSTRFQPETQRPDANARIDNSSVKGHFHDHGYPIMRQYTERLEKHGLMP